MLQAGRLLTTPFARRVSRAGGVRVSPSRPARFSRLSRPSVSSYTIPQFSSARSFYQKATYRTFCTTTVAHDKPDATIIQLPEEVLNAPRGADRVPLKLKPGDRLHGYEVLRNKYVEERQLMVWELEHLETGAKHVHIECDDTENAFTTILKTIPMNDTGVAHILEHLALCGSEKYPVRDPFFNMLKRSLSTFMNAWTGPDYTGYPFSTTNVKDYFNLMSVYLDAVFFPKLDYYDFLQEGHRLQLNEETSNLEHSGVVYNEMKGAMSDPADLFSRALHRELFPSVTYHYNSGGNPSAIREIQYDDVLKFHKEFYHPSNSFTMTYGDLPLAPQLAFVAEHAISRFNRIKPNSEVPAAPRFTEPRSVTIPGPLTTIADPKRQVKVSVAWLTNPITETYETICMDMLSMLLMSGPTSPMEKALISSNLGLSYAPGSGYDSSTRDTSFAIGLSDVHEDDVAKVEETILKTLEEAARTGFPQERVDALLHQIEFRQKHVTTGFGISLMSGLSHSWLHGGKPSELVALNEHLARLRADLAEKPLFQDLIKKHFLNNPHRVTLTMVPDAEYNAREQNLEDESLQKLSETQYNTEEALEKLVEETSKLEERQEQEPDISVLPKIRLSEISRLTQRVPVTHGSVKSSNGMVDSPIQFVDLPTSGISYMRANIDITDLPQHLVPYLPLFQTSLTSVGADDLNYEQLSHELDMTAGKFNIQRMSENSPSESGRYWMHFGLRSASLDRNLEKTFDLWSKVLTAPRFDDKARLKTLIGNMLHGMQSSMSDSGHSYAMIMAAAKLTGKGKINDLCAGIPQYNFIKKLHEMEDLSEVTERLTELSQFILEPSKVAFSVHAEKSASSKVESQVSRLLSHFGAARRPATTTLPHERLTDDTLKQWADPRHVYFGLNTQVHYVARTYRAVPYTHEDYSTLNLLSLIMGPNFLHKEIREKGGAYGSGLRAGSNTMSFYSYRDPNVLETLDAFERGIQWILDGEFTDENLEQAKLQLFSDLDEPVPPSQKGLRWFNSKITDDMAQQRRDRAFAATRDDVIAACHKYLVGSPEHPVDSAIAVFGSDQTKDFKDAEGWLYRDN